MTTYLVTPDDHRLPAFRVAAADLFDLGVQAAVFFTRHRRLRRGFAYDMSDFTFDCFVCHETLHTSDIAAVVAFGNEHKDCAYDTPVQHPGPAEDCKVCPPTATEAGGFQ